MKRCSANFITPIIKYGIQIDKNAKLGDLMIEIEKCANLPINKMMVADICNNKIYKTYDDLNL